MSISERMHEKYAKGMKLLCFYSLTNILHTYERHPLQFEVLAKRKDLGVSFVGRRKSESDQLKEKYILSFFPAQSQSIADSLPCQVLSCSLDL